MPISDTDPYASLTCPMPGCTEDLYIDFESTQPLYVATVNDREPLAPGGGDVSTWKVLCVEGHVVLVPAEPGCRQDDVCAGDCICDVDHGEETRTFRASDVDRLRALLATLGRAESSSGPCPTCGQPHDHVHVCAVCGEAELDDGKPFACPEHDQVSGVTRPYAGGE